MAQHRRVEPRGIIGTGMASDVDRIRDVEEDQERKRRAWRNAPEKGFGDVLADAPAKGELEEEEHDDPRKKKKAPESASPSAQAAAAVAAVGGAVPGAVPGAGAGATPAAVELAPAAAPSAKAELPKVPRDPRERLLREQLAKNLAQPRGATSSDTPPTGSHARKPAR